MSWIGRLRSWLVAEDASLPSAPPERPSDEAATPETPAEAPGIARSPPAAIQQLARVGLPDGPTLDEAIAVLRSVRGTVLEATAVSWALRDVGVRAVPDALRVACADILAARGDDQTALRMLEGISSTAGLILASDLYAASGQLARALGTIERVLARDIDAPGARERHQRWRSALGVAPVRKRGGDEVTVMAPQASGPYRLLREVARGGAGAVYEAEDDLLGRRVAFKVYHGRGKDRDGLEREARMAVRLAGPGVVRVFDADPAAGWVAFEWVARGSVRDLLKTGDLAPLAAIGAWARPLARALARVHAEGVVHADVKPANVLLRQANDPILTDFGIARDIGDATDGGSAGYLSPERLAGRPADPSDDVYGFGRILEDVLHRADEANLEGDDERKVYRDLAHRCLSSGDVRPTSAADLVKLMP